MIPVSAALLARFEACLIAREISKGSHIYYKKWLRFYLDFCAKYQFEPTHRESLAAFLQKLRDKKQTGMQQQQASHAVTLYYDLFQTDSFNKISVSPSESVLGEVQVAEAEAEMSMQYVKRSAPQAEPAPASLKSSKEANAQPEQLRVLPIPPPVTTDQVRSLTGASWVVEYTRLVEEIKIRHYSSKTLKTYRQWLRHFQTFTRSKPPESLTAVDVKEFLTMLAVKREVAASTQNQAFNALLFFYRHVLQKEFGKIEGVVRAKRRPYIPVVLSREEIEEILSHLQKSLLAGSFSGT